MSAALSFRRGLEEKSFPEQRRISRFTRNDIGTLVVTKKKVSPMNRFLSLLFCLSAIVSAKTFYISPNGNNADSGTASQPRKTIAYGLKLLHAGDTLIFNGGTYREELKLDRTGSEGAPITFMAAPGESVFIKGSDTVSGWVSAGNGVWNLPNWSINSQQVFVDGEPLQQIGLGCKYWNLRAYGTDTILKPVGRSPADLTPGSFYYDSLGKTLSVMLKDKSDPNSHKMEASVRARCLGLYTSRASYIQLLNLHFRHSNGSYAGFNTMVWTQVDSSWNWIIDSCSFVLGDYCGLALNGENHIVRNCRFERNGNMGLSVNGKYANRPRQNILLENLVMTGNNYRGFLAAHSAAGIKCVPYARGVTVRNCVASNNKGAGIWFDHCHGEIVIENNIVQGNAKQGIFYEISGPVGDDAFGAKIRNNLVTGSGAQSIYISASRGAIVSNNTLWKNWAGVVLHGMPRDAFQLKDNKVVNNITGDCSFADMILYTGTGSGSNSLDSNFYHNSVKLKFSIVTGPGYAITDSTISQLRAKGQEAQGASGDPLFINPANNDFCLASGSPAMGKGRAGDCQQTGIERPATSLSITGPQIQIAYSKGKPEFRVMVTGINHEGSKLSLFDTRGRMIQSASVSPNELVTWNLSNKSDGLFFLQLSGQNRKALVHKVMLLK